MVRTVEEHAEAIRELVAEALAGRGSGEYEVSPARLSSSADGHRFRVLADTVVSPLDLPPFDNSQMDGYAVHSADLAGDEAGRRTTAQGATTLRVAKRIAAGHAAEPLDRGWAAPIMTGAPIPAGADAVVPIEQARPDRFQAEYEASSVSFSGPVDPGLFVRTRGSDLARGSTLFEAGTLLGAAQWGALAAAGVERVRLVDRPRILLISTGAELGDEGTELGPAKIHDANGASMAVALSSVGAEVTVVRVGDDAEALLRAIREHLAPGRLALGHLALGGLVPGGERVDLIVTTGGVSAGAYEVVREAFESRGVTFSSVAMQPGGPQGWGVLELDDARVPVVCLPGNPVSVLVSFEAFLRLPLLEATGRRLPRRDQRLALAEGADSPPGKHQIRRGRIDDDGLVHLVGGASSHLLHAYAQSTVLVHVPVGVGRVEAGDEVVVWPLDD